MGKDEGMKITAVYGTERKSSTYHAVQLVLEQLSQEAARCGTRLSTREFFLPRDFHECCRGCSACVTRSEDLCPHADALNPIKEALDEADLMILASPVYVYHASGAMKSFLDHFAFRWMMHRPEGAMFRKTGLVVSTAAGGGMKTTNRDMKDSLSFWGVGRIYEFGTAVYSTSWQKVTPRIRERMQRKARTLSHKIFRSFRKGSPGLAARLHFTMYRKLSRIIGNPPDVAYWEGQGWLGKLRPWKTSS